MAMTSSTSTTNAASTAAATAPALTLPLLFGLQREQHAADAQEEIFEWDDHKRIQRVERQQMAAFAPVSRPERLMSQ